MKNIKYGVLFLALVGIGLVSCKKDVVEMPDAISRDYNVIVKNGVLFFPTIDDYEKAIKELALLGDEKFILWEENLDFISMRQNKSIDELEKLNIFDPLFACLINPYGIVEIEGFVYKVDLIEERVYAIPSDEYEDHKSFISKSNVKMFGIDEDILCTSSDESSTNKSYCDSQNTNWYTWYCSGGNVQYRNRYFKAGIYYSLVARVEPNGSGVNGMASTTKATCYWTNNNGSYDFAGSTSLQQSHHNLRPYSDTRRLTQFYFKADYYFLDQSTNTSYSPSLTISCN